jgi:hypothetical protein
MTAISCQIPSMIEKNDNDLLPLLAVLPKHLSGSRQAWNISTRQATTRFLEPRLHGFASRASISLSRGFMGTSCESISLSREFHIFAMKSHL